MTGGEGAERRSDVTDLKEIGRLLTKSGLKAAVAESCTGGLIGSMLTSMAGSSEYFTGGVIAYSNAVKTDVLGVSNTELARHGAVSAQVARQMAAGVCRVAKADIGLSVTGIAGPGGGSAKKPVGLVFIGVAYGKRCIAGRHLFAGGRRAVRTAAAREAIRMLKDLLNKTERTGRKAVK